MRIINILFLFCLLGMFSSCSKFLDVNENPNQPTTAPINGLLGSTTYSTATNVFNVGNLVSNYTQYLASPNLSSPSDIYEEVDGSGTWSALYDNMTDLKDLEKIAIEKGAPYYQGISKIMMAMHLSLIEDVWGSAPYIDAFSLANLNPKYDKAEDIYQTSIKLLDEGIALLQGSSSISINAALDFIHGGNVAAWIKTAFAMKARLLNQLSKTSQYNAGNVLTALASAYTSNTQDAQVKVFSVRNPWAGVAVANAGLILQGWLSKNFVDAMNGTTFGIADPRLPLITNLTKFGDYRGTRNGAGRVGNGTSNEESVLTTTGWYSSTNSPLQIATYAEMKFIEAEVTFPTDKNRSYNAYLDGIRAHMSKMGVSTAAMDTYVNSSQVSVGAGAISLKRIMEEKYKAMFLHPAAWTDARRFNYQYTGFQMPLNAVLSTFIRRMAYPSVELTRNGDNVPAVTGLDQRMWWDQN
ncbi:MAG: SusD/RagB family nutrient-binding outer membrane lipoprotein [Niabella sp.]|nr:MAG: SusD/RagB family nutrient-binding outer membrane lipoprotein [Niabella sp.]